MKVITAIALSGAMLVCMPAFAQIAPAGGAAVVPVAVVPVAVVPVAVGAATALPSGTPIHLKMAESITTKTKKLEMGYRFHMTVLDDIKVGERTVIPAGSLAMGEVTDVRFKGMWGKSGKINAQLLYVTVNGRQIKLRGRFDDKGVTGTAGVVAAIAFVPIAGFFTTGTSANIPEGAAISGFTDEAVD